MGARCIGLTVCAAPAPGDALSPFAERLHGTWAESSSGNEGKTINEVRREEERQAMRLLGLEPVWLDLPDAPYRQLSSGEYPYTSDDTLMSTVASEERKSLVPLIAEQIRKVVRDMGATGRVRVFAPLAVGRHVDHQLVYLAARSLGPRYGVLFYEDFPYATRANALEARLREIGVEADPRLVNIADLIGVKIASIARYKSQLPTLFGSGEAMPQAVRAYAESVGATGGLQMAERYWHIPPRYVIDY
jgi:LmbE family N-acetylglucosaminyl deacetylase